MTNYKWKVPLYPHYLFNLGFSQVIVKNKGWGVVSQAYVLKMMRMRCLMQERTLLMLTCCTQNTLFSARQATDPVYMNPGDWPLPIWTKKTSYFIGFIHDMANGTQNHLPPHTDQHSHSTHTPGVLLTEQLSLFPGQFNNLTHIQMSSF